MSGFKKFPRPSVLFPLFAPVETIKGVGKRLGEVLAKRTGAHVIDVLRHAPSAIIVRKTPETLKTIVSGDVVTLLLTPLQHLEAKPDTRRPYKVICTHPPSAKEGGAGAAIELVFFNAHPQYIADALPLAQPRLVSGRVEWYNQRLQMVHPDYIVPPNAGEDTAGSIPAVEPVYPATASLTSRRLYKIITTAQTSLPELPEWISDEVVGRFGFPSWLAAMQALHAPKNAHDLAPGSQARMRLAYDELLANQIALCLVRQQARTGDATATKSGRNHCPHDQTLAKQLIAGLPFTLTDGQKQVLREIIADQKSPQRMLRMLMGDVGAGKTITALIAMLNVVEAGRQAALIAPTEILARQHYATISDLLAQHLGEKLRVVLLIGQMKKTEKDEALVAIKTGAAHIIIGTHALISDQTQFHDLGFAVIDEQHRFGVRQRFVLGEKGEDVDVLLMTATPIPRSLAMTAYGDLDASRLHEKPEARQAIITSVMPHDKLEALVGRLKNSVGPDKRAYWICPLVEESDYKGRGAYNELAAAESRFAYLTRVLPHLKPALVHGKQSQEARTEAMQRFKTGDCLLLVATTVIEVGVDVASAGIIIIEDSDRFGLAQLHQLRGRVGRSRQQASNQQAACILLYRPPLNQMAHARLQILRTSQDGFHIAEEDLRLRGPGEVLGRRQSGEVEFIHAHLAYHLDLLAVAKTQAEAIVASDPALTHPQHEAVRILLALYERQHAVAYLAGG